LRRSGKATALDRKKGEGDLNHSDRSSASQYREERGHRKGQKWQEIVDNWSGKVACSLEPVDSGYQKGIFVRI